MNFLEIVQDRKGKLSLYKALFLIASLVFIFSWMISAISSKTVPEMPNSLSLFLGTVGGAQLAKSYMANKQEKNNSPAQ